LLEVYFIYLFKVGVGAWNKGQLLKGDVQRGRGKIKNHVSGVNLNIYIHIKPPVSLDEITVSLSKCVVELVLLFETV